MARIQRLLDYSMCRLLVGAIMVIGATLGTQFALAWAGSLVGFHASSPSWWGGFEFAASAVAAFFGYRLYAIWIEKRVPEELSPSHAWRDGAIGLVMGAGLFATTIGILAIFGLVDVSVSDKAGAARTLGIVLQAGVAEELLFRGLLLRLVERSLGTWPALGISALLFSTVHLFNPGAGIASVIAIASAALLQGAAYLYTRRLWVPIGLHYSWGLVESFIFGVPDSGHQYPGLLKTEVHGPDILSGGGFGVETSIVAIGLCIFVATVLLIIAYRRENIVPIHFGAGAKP
jgi:uncharacterized protein